MNREELMLVQNLNVSMNNKKLYKKVILLTRHFKLLNKTKNQGDRIEQDRGIKRIAISTIPGPGYTMVPLSENCRYG